MAHEIYIFEVRDGKLVSAVGVEDNLTRMRQLGIALRAKRPRDHAVPDARANTRASESRSDVPV